jgi:poly [ADP-ribose] polymerase
VSVTDPSTFSCTKGIGRTQPVKWQDAGDALDNDALKGCHMPAAPGEDVSAQNPGAYLQYNEVCSYPPRVFEGYVH